MTAQTPAAARTGNRDRRITSQAAGRPPEQHPFWERLESPLSTYYLLLATVAILLVIGLVMVLSASSITSLRQDQSSYTVFIKQAQFAVLGLIGAGIASRFSVATWKRLAVPVLLVAISLQLLVFTPLGVEVGGNRNWLVLGGFRLQPSELGKVALILYGASILSAKRKYLHRWSHAIVPLLLPVGAVVVGLVLLGRDLGTGLVLLAILTGIMWAAGISWRLFALAGAAFCALAVGLVYFSGNRMERINQWLSCTDVQQCWQSRHGQFALADGGLGGLGLGGSREKWLWLPEPHNDFIFAILGEELGLGGTLVVLALFALLALACYRVVLQTNDMFVRLATTGVMVWIIGQAMINIGAVIGLLPVIGVPLPLVSYGGSALVTTLGALGMVISFARGEPDAQQALAGRPSVWRRSLSVLSSTKGSRR
ncbi:putative lipid II flippase FtsW [Gephyromycinifex aptenodytis]|uniref:putative lipid II flippase FtsW n=1 Tax=Gephyromycinifex aptenodytis TaxID=2716227 RepID=UPI001D02902A|nr:putative lipid II flippase FtsW [Gephyromycinifex aptenodytis]